MKFNICPDCGAHLDFGEVCDCKEGPEASRSAAESSCSMPRYAFHSPS